MLFSSIVFMNRTLRGQLISVVIVCILKSNFVAYTTQSPVSDNAEKFDGEFDSFLKDLGTLIYRPKPSSDATKRVDHVHYTTVPVKSYRKSQNALSAQKDVLGDVLMLKLVSYYEDKYKLTRIIPTTTESITMLKQYTNSMRFANRIYSQVDRNGVVNSRPQNQATYVARRMQPPYEMDDDEIPEVITI
ncbi:uncharacterized protein LOC111358660 [Spodoptera litura]|uniref:Uncharacterized protein LOC111358660 n=1 Tax=Spodoptera litura TaxID=69820 RepID=A0A9J7J082_SPOLT|nr:uncharacterized protein LOC111358660 [Spodoptera litura]